MKQLKNFLIKREQSQACLSFAKREKSRLLAKTLLTLVALLAVTTGAYATDPNTVTWYNNGATWSGWAESETTHTVGDITITCSGNAKAYESTASGEPLAMEAGNNDAITFTSNGAPFASISIMTDDELNVAGWTYNSSTWSYEWSGEPTTSVTLSGCDIKADKITFTFAAGTPVTFTRGTGDKANEWTMDGGMPAGNVTVSVEYYDLATLATDAVTAATEAAANTDAELVTVADNAATGGTLMYYVTTDANFTQADAIALAETAWSEDVPTADGFNFDTATDVYVWYYLKGDAEHSDTDPVCVAVTVLPEPTYNVEFAEGTNPEAPADPIWTATPNTGVKKGQTVTVTYTGTRKVIGVKAEKKSGDKGKSLAEATVGMIFGSNGKAYEADDKDNLPDGVTAAGMVAYRSGTGGLIIALSDEASRMYWSDANGASGAAAHTPTVTGYSWKLPSMDEWQQMFAAFGGNSSSYTGLNTAIGNAGGTALVFGMSGSYWTSTKYSDSRAYSAFLYNGSAGLGDQSMDSSYLVRACIAF